MTDFTTRLDAIGARCAPWAYHWQLRNLVEHLHDTGTVQAVGIVVDASGADVARVTAFEKVPERPRISLNTVNPNGNLTYIEWPDKPSIEVFEDFFDAAGAYLDHKFEFVDASYGPNGERP